MINRGDRILIVFHLYCCSNHILSTILVANLARLVTLKILIQNIIHVFLRISSLYTCIIYD